MRFTDFLKATVLLMAGEATALGAISIAKAANNDDDIALLTSLGFIVVAALVGAITGGRTKVTSGFTSLLSDARTENALPPIRPGTIMVNRLWPLALLALLFAGASFFYPQIPGIAAAFLILMALRWRKQERAVAAIEERDGVRFYVRETSPFKGIELIRTPGMRRVTSANGAG